MAEILDKSGMPLGGSNKATEAFKGVVDAANSAKTFHIGKYENYKCSCGCQLFTTAVVIKKVPAIDLGEILNEDVPLPIEQIPVWVCTKCGEVAPFIKEDKDSMKIIKRLLREDQTEEKEQEETKS